MTHKRLTLQTVDYDMGDSNRPDLSVWHDVDDQHGVAVSVGPAWGQSQRFIDLSPAEARRFAKMLTDVAAEAEASILEPAAT